MGKGLIQNSIGLTSNSLETEYNNNLLAQSLKDTYEEYISGIVPTVQMIQLNFYRVVTSFFVLKF